MNGNDDRFPEIMDELPPVEVSRDMVFRCPENNAAIDYWRSKHGSRKMPARADIDPIEMRAFLPHVGLLETPDGTSARPDYRVALAGTAIEAVLGPLTGRLLREAVPPVIARRWRSLYDVVMTEAVPLRAVSRVAFSAQNFLMGEVLAAPLSADGRRIDTLFITLVFWSEPGGPAG
jgi:hypothetical protein